VTQISLGACADALRNAAQSASPAGGDVVTSDGSPVRLGSGEPVNWNGKGTSSAGSP
jgi:hypothetical protein